MESEGPLEVVNSAEKRTKKLKKQKKHKKEKKKSKSSKKRRHSVEDGPPAKAKRSCGDIVTNQSNGQSKLLTNKSSSKLGGIPTDPSKLVEIIAQSLEHPEPSKATTTTEILSSDSEDG